MERDVRGGEEGGHLVKIGKFALGGGRKECTSGELEGLVIGVVGEYFVH